jgi:hypothetical protein|tara:strand:- start:716 stop:1093 length:378 start_codon:yes stop_codon:yes gene_type:complete
MKFLTHNWINTALVIAVLVLVLVGGNQSGLGGSTAATWTAGNLVSNGTLAVTGATTHTGAVTHTADATFSGGNSGITITTTNSATSSIEVGCIDTYATSTATAIRLSATTTPGIAYWTYGNCSGL